MENIPLEGIFDIYQEYKDDEDQACRFQDFSGESTSVIKTYDTLGKLVKMVRDYGEMAKDAQNMKSAVGAYRDVFARVYKDTSAPDGGIDKDKVHFESADLEILNNALSSLSDSKIAKDHIRYWREERGEDVSFPENFTEHSAKHLTGYLGEVMYCSYEETAQDHEVLSNSRESLGWIYKAAQIMIWSITDANYRYSKYHGMNYALGEIEDINKAVEEFYYLADDASKETVCNALSSLITCIQEERRLDYRMQEIKEMLEDEQTGQICATYLAQMVAGWRVEEGFEQRFSKENTYESADRNLEELARSLEWSISQYESVGAKKEFIDDLISCCKEILPKSPEDGCIDSSKAVDEATLEKINQDLAQILQIFGGDEYVNSWNAKDGQQGEYPVSGLTQENVKSYLWDIAARICKENDEEKVPYAWKNWNYDYEILNANNKSMKAYRDIAELIVESIGWRVEAVRNPYELIVDNPGV